MAVKLALKNIYGSLLNIIGNMRNKIIRAV